jgi:alpha-mannosidase
MKIQLIRVTGSWGIALLFVTIASLRAADLPKRVFLVSNFHPACCGWLTDWSTERNYCANTYLDHLDRVRDDANYAFALSEVPNMIAILNFHGDRVQELKQRIKEGRVELCNAFFLEPTINLSGGEALVKNGVEGLRWQTKVLGFRPRFAWMIDVTGTHEQMAQIAEGLGLDAIFYTRHNPTGYALHWLQSPDGSRALAVSPGHYSEWNSLFKTLEPLNDQELKGMLKDIASRADTSPLTAEEINRNRRIDGSGLPPRAPERTPVLILVGSGDYSLAPLRKSHPTEFLAQMKKMAPQTDISFTVPSRYADAVMPAARNGSLQLPTVRGGTAFSFNAFWIENPYVKHAFRHHEQKLQAAEMMATIASLKSGYVYPVQSLYHAWLMMMLNMDRNSLWGSAGGMVFEHEKSWDVRDRYEGVGTITEKAMADAASALLAAGDDVSLFNALNWDRQDPVILRLPARTRLKDWPCQSVAEDGTVIARPRLGSMSLSAHDLEAKPAEVPASISLPGTIETDFYRARINPLTGAIISLTLKPSGREVIGGPANVVVAEKPRTQHGDPGDHIVDRPERERLADSNRFKPEISVSSGPLATTVRLVSAFYGGGKLVRTMRFYASYPRIDFGVELNDIPDRTVVTAEFPLAEDVAEIRRGIPYGFSHGAWTKGNSSLAGWTKGIVPAVRWSHYALAGGGGIAILDRGLSGREITGRTPVIFLLNATDTYYGYPNRYLSGKGKHRLEYAIVAHESGWEQANIPRLAWEFNNPPYLFTGSAGPAAGSSVLGTSDNLIVEAMRREGDEIELRLAESLGRPGMAVIALRLPHQAAGITDLNGNELSSLKPSPEYRFPVRPQQILTLRFRTGTAVAPITPLTDWSPLVPPPKRAALNTRIDKKGHPPRGDLK